MKKLLITVVVVVFFHTASQLHAGVQKVDGWLEFTPSEDTKKIYVSTSGKDTNSGLTPDSPVKTAVRANMLVRHGFPDWVLFKRGDVWTDVGLGKLTKSGRSLQEPIVYTAYGDEVDRPKFDMIANPLAGIYTRGGGGAPLSTNYVAFDQLYFTDSRKDPANSAGDDIPGVFDLSTRTGGVSWLRGTDGLWFNDVVFKYLPVVFQQVDTDSINNVIMNRVQILDAYARPGSYQQGMFLHNVDNLLLDEVFYDHNGWHEHVEGVLRTKFSHNIYGNTPTDFIVRSNLNIRAAANGIQARVGGQVLDSIFSHNPISIYVDNETFEKKELSDVVRNNIVLNGEAIPDGAIGWGIEIKNNSGTGAGVEFSGNVVANCLPRVGCSNYHLGDNVEFTGGDNIAFNWEGKVPEVKSVPDGNRTLMTYNANVGGEATIDAFSENMRAQSKMTWNPAFDIKVIHKWLMAGYIGEVITPQ